MDPIKRPTRYQEMTDPQARPRYTGIPTFFRAPHTESLADTDIGVIGVPYDGGVTNRTGARHGPRAVRDQSSLLRRLHPHGIAPFDIARVRDLGDCWIEQPYTLEGALGRDRRLLHHDRRGEGGAAVGRRRPFDQPADPARGRRRAARRHDPYRRALRHRRRLPGLALPPRRAVPPRDRGGPARSGTGDPDRHPRHHQRSRHVGVSARSGMRVLPMEEFHDKGWRYAAEEARRVAGSGPTYLTFDIDSLDPSQAPGTGTPEAGGITALEALRLLRALRGIDFIGGDLVEVAPPFDVGTITSFNGASVLFEILCLLAEAWQKRHR